MSYCGPPRLYVLSLKALVDVIEEWFDEGGSEKLTKSELALPTSICNHLIARFMSICFTSKSQHTKSLLSAIVDSPWCRFTKLYMKYSRDGVDYPPLTTLFHRPLTELSIECDASDCRNINLTEVGRSLGNSLVSLTLKNCNIDYESLQYGFSFLTKLVYFTAQHISFYGPQSKMALSVLPCLELLDLSFADVITIENIISVQKSIKVLQLYSVPIHMDVFSLLTNLVVLDISRKVHAASITSVDESALMASLSKMSSLKSLDVSCREISDADVQMFDKPHHRMRFLGLYNITLCNHQDINADQV